jgi:hypothetical protein
LLRQLPPGVESLRATAMARAVSSINMDVIDSTTMTKRVMASTIKPLTPSNNAARSGAGFTELSIPPINFGGIRRYELHVPFKAPENGILKLHPSPNVDLQLNGLPHPSLDVPLKAEQTVLLSFAASEAVRVGLEWTVTKNADKY